MTSETRHRELADGYRKPLADARRAVPPSEPSWARSNWQSFCVSLPEGCDPIRVMQNMLDAGVSTRGGIIILLSTNH